MKTANTSSLKSVLAISVGASAAALPASEAAIIVTDLNNSVTIGFGGGLSEYIIDLPGTRDLRFFTTTLLGFFRGVDVAPTNGYVQFLRQTNSRSAVDINGFSVILRTGEGVNWDQAAGAAFGLPGGYASGNLLRVNNDGVRYGPPSMTDKFMFFRFRETSGDPYYYGFVEISSGTITDGVNPSITLRGWAYSDTPTIQVSTFAIPEPSSAGMVMGGALLLGAAGLRRWRKNRSVSKVTDLV